MIKEVKKILPHGHMLLVILMVKKIIGTFSEKRIPKNKLRRI